MKKIYTILLAGTVLVTGALSAQIPMAWGKRYNAPPDMSDEARSIAVDASGNSYVTGSGFNSGGNLDVITVKYDVDGNQMWVRNYDRGITDNDEGRQLVLDAAGNIYVVGYSKSTAGGMDLLVLKYDNAGNQQWASFYNGAANGMDEGRSLAVNAAGDVFAAGYASDSAFFYNALTVKFNSAGVQQWAVEYDGPINGSDELLELTIDASSNVYVVGNTETSTANYDYLTIKYDASGNQQWLMTYDGPGQQGDYAKGITLDNNNNVIVTGQSFQTGNWFDYYTIKYNNAGAFQWGMRYNNGNNRYEDAWDVTTDQAGFIYITGQSQATGNNSTPPDCATIKYSPAGGQVWLKRWDGGFNNNDDRAYAIVLDDTANVYITGYSKNGSYTDYITIKYDSAGTEEYALRYNSQYNLNDASLAIALWNGDIFVTGKSANLSNEDFFTIRYSYSAVGVNEQSSELQSLTVYPVPSSDVINVSLAPQNNASSLTITDLTGRVVSSYTVSAGLTAAQISVADLASGNYILTHVNSEGEIAGRSRIVRN